MKAVVVTASGLRPDYIGCYGNQWIHTPALDRLAADGIVFDRHYADCPDCAGARRAWRNGRYCFPLPEGEAAASQLETDDLIGLLRRNGVATGLVQDARLVHATSFAADWESLYAAPIDQRSSLDWMAEAAIASLKELRSREQWLLWIDLATLLPPWDQVPDEFTSRIADEAVAEEPEEEPLEPLIDPAIGLIDPADERTGFRLRFTYAGAVGYLDAGLSCLLEGIKDCGLDGECTVIVTADQGLPLGERGLIGACRPWLHEELVHLPLVIRLPGGQQAGLRVSGLTQQVDLQPTLLEAFGLQPLSSVHGQSLWPLIRSEAGQVREFACAGLRTGDALEWAIRTPEWAFLLPLRAGPSDPPRGPQLYVKPDDPWEVNNVLQHHMKLAEHLEQLLREFVRSHG